MSLRTGARRRAIDRSNALRNGLATATVADIHATHAEFYDGYETGLPG
jgi:hypothetical protein